MLKKKVFNKKNKKNINSNLTKNNILFSENLSNNNINYLKKPSYKEVLLSEYINNAITEYKNTWDIIEDTELIKKEIEIKNKESYSIFNIFRF